MAFLALIFNELMSGIFAEALICIYCSLVSNTELVSALLMKCHWVRFLVFSLILQMNSSDKAHPHPLDTEQRAFTHRLGFGWYPSFCIQSMEKQWHSFLKHLNCFPHLQWESQIVTKIRICVCKVPGPEQLLRNHQGQLCPWHWTMPLSLISSFLLFCLGHQIDKDQT